MKKNKYKQPDYITYEDLLEKLGYKKYKPKIGNLGRAIMDASKNHRSVNWLKNQLDAYFENLRGKRNNQNDEQQKRSGHPF